MQSDINAISPEIQGAGNPPAQSEDAKLIKMITDMMAEGTKSSSRWNSKWDTYWKYYHDKQWDDQSRAPYRAKPVINIIRHAIQAQLPILTDNKPGFDILPNEPADFEFADILSKATQFWWEKYQNDSVVIDVLMDAMVADVGVYKMVWDEELEGGAGDINMKAVNPKDIFLNRDAISFRREDGCNWVIHRMYKTVGWAKLKFPDKADQISGDSIGTQKNNDDKNTSVNSITLVSPTDQRDDRGQTPETNETDDRDLVELWEVWMDDETIEEYVVMEEDGNPKIKEDGSQEKELRKKYPEGRLVTIIPNKKIVLQNTTNPYRGAVMNNPFKKNVDNCLPRSFPGEGEAKILMEIQRLLNKNAANIVDYMTIMSNPVWKIRIGATDNPEMITNRAGLVILINDGYGINDIVRDIPPALPANATEFYNLAWETANKLTGMSELSQGRRSQGDPTSGFAIVQMQEASQTRMRLKERNLQRSLSQVGNQWVCLALQFYKSPRISKITGKDGWPDYFEWYVEESDDGKYNLNKKEYKRVEDANGRPKYIPEPQNSRTAPSKGVFDARVLAGSSMPFAKAQRDNMAFKLYDSQIIDDEEVLNTLEWPEKETVLNRKREKEAQAQAQQAQQPPPQ